MNNVLRNLSFYLPSIFTIIDENDLDWTNIDSLFKKKIEKRIQECKGETIIVETTIYDLIIEVKKKNSQALRLLDFINKLFYELSGNLDTLEKQLVKNNIRNILINFDMRYLNFIGEIAVLNSLMKTKKYSLEGIETKLSNNKSIDFKLKQYSDNSYILIEIVNIHLNSDRIEKSNVKIDKFLTERLEQKVKNKKQGLFEDINFYLIPVLWGNSDDLKIYSDYFIENSIQIKNVIEPLSYLTFIDPNDETYFLHRFGKISDLFKTE